MKVLFGRAARTETTQALKWYLENIGPMRAEAFERDLAGAVELAARNPELGTPGVGQTRNLPLSRFPYTLHYVAHAGQLQVLAVAHQRRKPGYWAKR